MNGGKPWRVQSDDRGEFDEIAVGGWLHVERLDTNAYFVAIGERRFWVHVGKKGAQITHEEDVPRAARHRGA